MTIVIDSEVTLGLFYLVSRIVFTFLLIMIRCSLLFIVDLSLTTVLLIIHKFILIHGVVSSKTS